MVHESSKVPFDVIAQIMASSPPSTISSLMATCRVYYEEGPKHLLRDGVVLSDDRDMRRFAAFIFASDSSRFKFFKKLDLTLSRWFAPTDPVVAHIVELLASPSLCLETLILRRAESMLSSCPGVRDAIVGLTSIKHLVVREGWCVAHSVVMDIRSPLSSITFSSTPPGLSGLPTSSTSAPSVQGWLDCHSSTLESILTDLVVRTGEATLLLYPPSNSIQYLDRPHARIRKLGILCDPDMPDLDILLICDAFPNLSCLELVPNHRPSLSSFKRYRHHSSTEILDLHSKNKETQLRSGWPRLEQCSGELEVLYAQGLVCEVDDLRVWRYLDIEALPLLCEVLKDTRPTKLCFSVVDIKHLRPTLLGLYEHERKPLRALEITVNVSEYYDMADTKRMMVSPVSQLRQ